MNTLYKIILLLFITLFYLKDDLDFSVGNGLEVILWLMMGVVVVWELSRIFKKKSK